MNDYSFYIWSAYGVTAFVMLFLWVSTLKRSLKNKKALKDSSEDGI
jgi:heme exporter protein CcmD